MDNLKLNNFCTFMCTYRDIIRDTAFLILSKILKKYDINTFTSHYDEQKGVYAMPYKYGRDSFAYYFSPEEYIDIQITNNFQVTE